MRPAPTGAVLLRSGDAETVLQGLRTAVSLALGDRTAQLLVVRPATATLAAAVGEMAAQVEALVEAGVPITAEAGAGADNADRATILTAAAGAAFQQVF